MDIKEKAILSKAQKLNHWNSKKLYYAIGKKHQRLWTVKRGEVYFVDLGENIGSEQSAIRPCVVLQSNAYNFKSPVFTCAIISNSRITIPDIQILITNDYYYIDENSVQKKLSGAIDLGQIKTVAKERLLMKVCDLKEEISDIDKALLNALGLSLILKKKDNIITSLQGKIQYMKENLQNCT